MLKYISFNVNGCFREITENLCKCTFLVFFSHFGSEWQSLEGRHGKNEVEDWDNCTEH